jgi:hypothetical protein
MKALASYEYRIAKSVFAQNNGGSLIKNNTMTRQQIKHALTSAIPTIACAIVLALSFWVISATEARAGDCASYFLSAFCAGGRWGDFG